MKPIKKLSLAQHKGIGYFLKLTTDIMCHLSVLIRNTYGKNSRIGKQADKASRELSTLKSLLDDEFWQEHQKEIEADRADTDYYYGYREWSGLVESELELAISHYAELQERMTTERKAKAKGNPPDNNGCKSPQKAD